MDFPNACQRNGRSSAWLPFVWRIVRRIVCQLTGLRLCTSSLRLLPLLSFFPVLVLSFSFTSPSCAASGSWVSLGDTVFHHIGRSQGLPNQVVTALAEDSAGFIWMGTQGGLARWDGYRFKSYQPDPLRAGSLPDNNITFLFSDPRGVLWVGSSAGLARHDAASDQFTSIVLNQKGGAVTSMADDGQAGFWVASRNGLQHIHHDGRLLPPEPGLGHLAQEDVRVVLREPGGRLWVGSRNGLWYRNAQGQSFRQLPFAGGQALMVLSLQRGRDGKIWIGTNGSGAFLLDPVQMTAQPLRGQGSDSAGLGNLAIQAIRDTGAGEMWLATSGYGILAVDLASLRVRRLYHEVNLNHSLADNMTFAILLDRTGLIWVATSRGSSRFDSRQKAISTVFGNPLRPDRLADTDVSSIKAMPDGSLWVGLRGKGINIFHPNGQVKWLASNASHPETALPLGPVRAISSPIHGRVYLASNRGLYRSDIHGGQVQRMHFRQRDPALAVSTILQQGERLWLGGVDGLWLLDFSQGEPQQLQRVAGSEFLNKQLVTALALTGTAKEQSVLWLGTRESGLVRFDQKSGRFTSIRADAGNPNALSSDSIACLMEDKRGWLWVCTQGGGISILPQPEHESNFRFRRIGRAQGLPNNMVNLALADDKQQVWVSTDDGLARIDPASMTVLPLRFADGVVMSTHWTNSGTKTPSGELLFGGAGGITLVSPDQFKPVNYRPPLVLSHLDVGGKEMNPDRFNHGTAKNIEPITIYPHANKIKVEFAALDYRAPEYNRYAWRLDGFDTDWINADAKGRLAYWSNLAPGTYTMRLRGSNYQGLWNDDELRVPIQVLPAWYQTWWWYLLLASLLLAAVWLLVHGRTGYLRKQHTELEQVVAQRTTQLLQQAKIASLGTLTAGIAHEINNPSNFAHVGAYNLGTQLQEFQQLLRDLAGDDAPQELHDTLQQHFDRLHASLAAISEGTRRIRDLVKDLRTFSRLDEAQWKPVAIADSLTATVNLVRTQYMNQVEIRCDLAANPVIECSPAQLNQVFMNLIVNACQAICSRPPEVCAAEPGLLLIRSKIVGKWLVFEFEDNGGGMPDAIRERIFDPFFTTKTVGEGMGMGLSISLGIIQKHRGTIDVRSTPGHGSCFIISLLLLE
jgi:signal transduction histidine kinase/ligand-binding sensor domain-containing protein